MATVKTGEVWPAPPASVKRWALVAVGLVVVAIILGAIAAVLNVAFDLLLTLALVFGALAIAAAVVALVISVRARAAHRRASSSL